MDISYNRIKSLKGIRNLNRLQHFVSNNNPITDLREYQFLSNCIDLSYLELARLPEERDEPFLKRLFAHFPNLFAIQSGPHRSELMSDRVERLNLLPFVQEKYPFLALEFQVLLRDKDLLSQDFVFTQLF